MMQELSKPQRYPGIVVVNSLFSYNNYYDYYGPSLTLTLWSFPHIKIYTEEVIKLTNCMFEN